MWKVLSLGDTELFGARKECISSFNFKHFAICFLSNTDMLKSFPYEKNMKQTLETVFFNGILKVMLLLDMKWIL